MTPTLDYIAAKNWLADCRRPLLVTHRRPDGDALGALAATTMLVRALGLEPHPTLFDPFPARYTWLEALAPWHDWSREHDYLTNNCDALVILDTCAVSQLEPIAEFLPRAPRTLVIDHHPTRDAIATRPGDLRLLDESAGAACLLIAECIKAAGIHLTPPLATALFVGLATDTGWFRFSNADARLLRVAADLMEGGAVGHTLYRAIHENDPPARLRLLGRLLQTLELQAGGRLVVLRLRQADFVAAGADRAMTEDLINEAGRLAGIEALVQFTEEADGSVRVNFRSKQALDVAALAARFGGGGHARAAGARPTGTWDEVVPRVLAATIDALR
jgi:phosphoesterase RecJ-like protein